MIRTYKYRLRPTKKQGHLLNRLFGQMQTVYNDALNERREAWKRSRKSVTYVQQWNRMRVTADEYEAIRQSADLEGLSMSEWARRRMFGGEP